MKDSDHQKSTHRHELLPIQLSLSMSTFSAFTNEHASGPMQLLIPTVSPPIDTDEHDEAPWHAYWPISIVVAP